MHILVSLGVILSPDELVLAVGNNQQSQDNAQTQLSNVPRGLLATIPNSPSLRSNTHSNDYLMY